MFRCSSCTSGTYSFADPFTIKTCQKCLNHTVCLGGSIMYPAEGYWRIDSFSENLVKCPQSESCLYLVTCFIETYLTIGVVQKMEERILV